MWLLFSTQISLYILTHFIKLKRATKVYAVSVLYIEFGIGEGIVAKANSWFAFLSVGIHSIGTAKSSIVVAKTVDECTCWIVDELNISIALKGYCTVINVLYTTCCNA